MGCLLERPDQKPFAGVQWQDGWVEMQAKELTCCGGCGLLPRGDALERCDLHPRLQALRSLSQDFATAWQRPFDPAAWPKSEAWPELDLGRGELGWKIERSRSQTPSQIWPWAAHQVWHDGWSLAVLSWGRSSLDQWYDRVARMKSIPRLVMVEGVDKLLQPTQADAFEGFIRFIYDSKMLVVLELVRETPVVQAEEPKSSFSTKGYFSRRLARARGRHPWEFLAQDCRSRLSKLEDISL